MRRKIYDVLFQTRTGMTDLVKQPSLWRSGFYFTLSVGLFSGVVTNTWLVDLPLSMRLGTVLATVIVTGVALALYGFLLHGILETVGALAGDARVLICLLGYTALPFLLLTPLALLAGKLGLEGLIFLAAIGLVGLLWMLYLLIRSLEVTYIIDFKRSASIILFSLLLLYIVFVLPWRIVFNLLWQCWS